jgi:hypothetical protein
VDDDHLPRERFFQPELSGRELREVVRHLLRRRTRPRVSADGYDAAFQRLLGSADAVQTDWTRERRRASILEAGAELVLAD